MVFLPPSILVLLYAFPYTRLVFAQSSITVTYILQNDVTAIIPSCAQTCFESFIQSNFPINVCSSTPSLDCLCSHNSTSGYTVGEGALQCILSEDNVGACQGANATTDTVTKAYNMCFGRANAIANTHATITATLVVESSAPSIVFVATTSTDNGIPGSVVTTTSASPMSSLLTASASPSLGINGTAGAVGQAAPTSTATASLTNPQIAGIAIGSATLFILAIGSIIICGYMRRRRILGKDADSDFGTFQEEHGNSMERMFAASLDKQHGAFIPGGMSNGSTAKVPPRVPPPPVMTDPNMFSRRSIPTDQIGVAMSPEIAPGLGAQSSGRYPEKLLPERPTLPLQQSTPDARRHDYHELPAGDTQMEMTVDDRRESAATQFELDITSPVEFSRGSANFDYGRAYTYEVQGLQPLNVLQQEPPRSMTASAPIVMAAKVIDIRKTQSHQSFSQPLQPLQPRTAVSSVYTGRGSLSPSDASHMPKNGQRTQIYKPINPYKKGARESVGSITSMESGAEMEMLRGPDTRALDLSPVVESPSGRSPAGRSPVSYPKIPSRLSDQISDLQNGPKFPKMPVRLTDQWSASPQQPDHELWRDAEIEPAKKRGRRYQESREEISRPLYYETNPHQSTRRRNDPQTIDGNLPLAQRRGNKLAPAIDLDRETKVSRKERKWEIVNQDQEELNMIPKSPAPWQPMLTPKKVGDDMFLGVNKY